MIDRPTIGQVADLVGLSADTLRWYERIGLLEAIPRDRAGQRRYRQLDLERLELLIKMRATGMPLTEMHQYVALIHGGTATRPDRLELLETHRQRTLDRIAALQHDLVVIDRKSTAIAAFWRTIMHKVTLGKSGADVSAIGLGCMGMSALYGPRPPAEQSIHTIHRAIDLGIDLIDTSASYGDGHNEQLIAKAIHDRRDQVFLCTKFGIRRDDGPMRVDSTPAWARTSCDKSLQRLGVDHIDLFYLHRRDPQVPIEDTIGAMAELVTAGKVHHLGLSEVNPQTLRQAHATHPIAALQTEYSLFSRDVEEEILPACRELGIALIAYSPISRAMLTGQITADSQFGDDDLRRSNPRFAEANRVANLALVDQLHAFAAEIDATPAQLALAWLLAQGTVPIPGTTKVTHLEHNASATTITLTPEQLQRIDDLVPDGAVRGQRLAEPAARWIGK